MLHVAKVMAATAVDALSNKALIERAKADMRVRTDGNPYVCPMPETVKPAIKPRAA